MKIYVKNKIMIIQCILKSKFMFSCLHVKKNLIQNAKETY